MTTEAPSSARDADRCPERPSIAIPFEVGPRVRIRPAPALSPLRTRCSHAFTETLEANPCRRSAMSGTGIARTEAVDVADRAVRPQNQLLAGRPRRASAIRSLPWQTARRSRKSPRHATGFAPTMSASPSPGTNEPAASKSATASSMRRNRRSKPNPLRPTELSNANMGIGCNASTKGAYKLARLGFRAKELLGGIDWWRRDGHPVAASHEPGSLLTAE
jgi:hypothetical protein